LNILILGGNGFIGSHLVDKLKTEHKVTILDKFPNQFGDEYDDVNYHYGDFGDIVVLSKALEGQDIVYHMLSTTVPYTADLDPIFDVETNLINTLRLLDLIVEKGIQRIVFASSGGTVYGKPQYLPINENHPCNPLGSYGIIKKTIEQYIKMYALKHNLKYLIVRPSNPYGPRQNYNKSQGLIAKLIYSGLNNQIFTVWGDGSAVRDYIYIDDLIDFLKTAGLSSESGIYNVGSGIGKSIIQIINSLSKVVDKMPQINFTAKKVNFVERVILDISSSKNKFDWTPKVNLEEGLKHHNNWMKTHKTK
jgi:UDP-glucose 4-epimerase